MSKRNYKRLLKKQSILYKNRCSENEILISPSVNSENFVEPECSVSSQIDFPNYSLREKIKNWYIETGPSRKCFVSYNITGGRSGCASLSCSANG